MTKNKNQTAWAIGVDIGGTGIKVGLADVARGRLVFKRIRVLTPQPSTPDAVLAALGTALDELHRAIVEDEALLPTIAQARTLPVGVAFPGVMKGGIVSFTGNLGPEWPGFDLSAGLAEVVGRSVPYLNDADAAGLAELTYGAGRDWKHGTVLMTTLGTGIGTALFTDGKLYPDSELGHIEIDGQDAETRAAQSAREREGLTFAQWAQRLQRYYDRIEHVLNPDYIIVGGGVSKQWEEFLPLLNTRATMVPADLRNRAGIIGAALAAATGGKLKAKVPKALGKHKESAR